MAKGFPPTWYYKGKGVYTIPAIIDPPAFSGGPPSLIADSRIIAEYLDSTYSSTPCVLPPQGKCLARHDQIIKQFEAHVLPSMIRIILPNQKKITDELDAKLSELRHRPLYFGGKSYAEAFTDPEERKQIWDTMREGMENLSLMIDGVAVDFAVGGVLGGVLDTDVGVYIFGKQPTFADIVLISHFCWAKALPTDPLRDPGVVSVWEEMRTWNGGRWERMLGAFERDYGCQHPKGFHQDTSPVNEAYVSQARL
jgi:glutathione S-transferase